MTKRVQRRSQAERKEALLEAVLTAAVSLLHEQGYGATTTTLVVERAGISRGAMLNHFPTKADLMTFVVEAVYQDELKEYERVLAGITDPAERIHAYPMAAWKVLSRPSGVAVLEILMGSRSDEVLAEKLKPIQLKIQSNSLQTLEKEFGRAPDKDLVRLVTWAVRGLSIDNVLSGRNDATSSIRVLQMLIDIAVYLGKLPRVSGPRTDEAISGR